MGNKNKNKGNFSKNNNSNTKPKLPENNSPKVESLINKPQLEEKKIDDKPKLKAKVETSFYTIRCISNLHVGTNNSNFGIIDNEVQKDSITNLPIINSSSLKGALREFFTIDMDKTQADGTNDNMVTWIFGPKSNKSTSSNEGHYKFFQADLLARPVRSNKKPYFLVLSPMVITAFLDKIKIMNISLEKELEKELNLLKNIKFDNNKAFVFEENLNDVILEDIKAVSNNTKIQTLKSFLANDNIAIMNDDDFKKLDLPVIARNKLEDGESKNLWYEEIVPRESVFYFFITIPTNIASPDDTDKINPWKNQFENSLKDNLVQFGGNKSIGYGFCKLKKGN